MRSLIVFLLFIGIIYCQSCDNASPDWVNLTQLPQYQGNPDLCSYSGQVDITQNLNGSQTIFYWYFFNDTQPDLPVMIWLQGGPGASGMFCLFKESGPLQFVYEYDSNYSTNPNDKEIIIRDRANNWLQYSHLIFVDQPRGTGFSFTDYYNYDELQTAVQFQVFVERFLKIHPNIATNDWYIYGESYAGKYAPYITRQLLNSTLGKQIKGMSIIDPLVFAGLQKTTSRNQIYAGLNIMSLQEMSQFNTLQYRCSQAVFTNASNMTKSCSALEDYISNQTSNIDLQDVRFYHDSEGFDLIDFYFNEQDEDKQFTIIQTLHLNLNSTVPTPKQPPLIFKSQSGVYDTFAKSNDIYGDNSIPIIQQVAQQIPVQIVEGVYDTLDGILPIEFYKQIVTDYEDCDIRVPMKLNYGGQCITKGFTQNCSTSKYNFQVVGVWNAGHMVPFNQLVVSNYLLDKFMTGDTNYCDNSCNCSLNRSSQLNNCNGNGVYVQQGSESYCKCNPGYVLGDCSQFTQTINFNSTSKIPELSIYTCSQNYYILNYTKSNESIYMLTFQFNQYNSQNQYSISEYTPDQNLDALPVMKVFNSSLIPIIFTDSKILTLIIKNVACSPYSIQSESAESQKQTITVNLLNQDFDNQPIIDENNKLNGQKHNDQILIGCASGFIFLSLIFLIMMIRKFQNKQTSENQIIIKNPEVYQTDVSGD